MYSCASQRQASRGQSRGQPGAGLPGRRLRGSLSFSQTPYRASRYFAASSKPPRPGASSFERLISDAYLFSRLAVRSRIAAARSLATISLVVPRPSTRPRGDFPQPPAHQMPRHGALGRAREPARRWPIHRQHRATAALTLHRCSIKIRRLGPQGCKSHARRFATGTQSCAASPARFRGIERNSRVSYERLRL